METLSQRGINLAAPRLCLPGESRVKNTDYKWVASFQKFFPTQEFCHGKYVIFVHRKSFAMAAVAEVDEVLKYYPKENQLLLYCTVIIKCKTYVLAIKFFFCMCRLRRISWKHLITC